MLPDSYQGLDKEILYRRILDAKAKLSDRLLILAHHYQRDDVYQFGDIFGDSLKLSRLAAEDKTAEFIVFCGVHFMAETADIVSHGQKIVTLPDITAGCPMADSAQIYQVEKAWKSLTDVLGETICPVTYINSYASLKAFCGLHGGLTCTSTNADKVLEYAFNQKERVFFFPDQHLGRNIGVKRGVPLDKIVLFNPFKPLGGLTEEQLLNAQIILWSGCCPVHDRFKVEDVLRYKELDPDVKILVHPEVPYEVAMLADYMGSTEYIIRMIDEAPAGSSWVIATEIHLVSRLINKYPDKKIKLLGKPICMCSMMDRTSPEHLCYNLEQLVLGNVINRISVAEKDRENALVALSRMLAL